MIFKLFDKLLPYIEDIVREEDTAKSDFWGREPSENNIKISSKVITLIIILLAIIFIIFLIMFGILFLYHDSLK